MNDDNRPRTRQKTDATLASDPRDAVGFENLRHAVSVPFSHEAQMLVAESVSQLPHLTLSVVLVVNGCADVGGPADNPSGSANEPEMGSYASDFNNIPPEVYAGFDREIRPIDPSVLLPGASGGVVYTYAAACPEFLGCETFRAEVDEAFAAWRDPGMLEFRREFWADADIRIAFEDSAHSFPCDQGYTFGAGTLAHTFSEGCQTGEIHVNADLQWSLVGTRTSSDGAVRYDVRTVLTHEIGHLLGLEHSADEVDVMHAAYNGSKRRVSENTLAMVRDALRR